MVDDDEGFRYLTRIALEQADFDVGEADDGDVAVARFRELTPDIIHRT